MSSYIERIKALTAKAFSRPKAKTTSVNKQHLLEDINLTKKKFEIFIKCIESMPMSYRKQLADKIFDLAATKTNTGCVEYVKMAKGVRGKDLSVAYSTFEICSKGFIEIIDRVLKDFNKIFEGRELRIENVTLGQFAVFGMMEQASVLSKYNSYLLDMVTHNVVRKEGVSELAALPQYKVAFVAKNSELAIALSNELKTGYINYVKDIKNVVSSSNNVKLVNNDGESNVGMIDPDDHSSNFFLKKATYNPFFILGETWVIIRHWIFQKQVKEKEYLESHIALLRMELDGKDPDSPEYQHHIKVIDAYNRMLADLDQKISKYEER